MGYYNIQIVESNAYRIGIENRVASIMIDGEYFTGGDCYIHNDTQIVIEYYKLGIEVNDNGFIGSYYESVVAYLEKQGFTNIVLLRSNDLSDIWFDKDGIVESITINGIKWEIAW